MAVKKGPLVRAGNTMTEAEFLNWVRAGLRARSLRWPPRAEALRRARREYKGENKRQKWEHRCAICLEWNNAKNCQVDHYPVAAGAIPSISELGVFANNLFCEVDNFRVLCKACHNIHTLAEKNGTSFEVARIDKLVNEKLKDKNLLAYLAEKGYNGDAVSNQVKRKALLYKLITQEADEQ